MKTYAILTPEGYEMFRVEASDAATALWVVFRGEDPDGCTAELIAS